MNMIKKKAYAKINIALDVREKRDDGYHDVRMIMNQIGLHDIVSLSLNDSDEITVSSDSANIPCDNSNLAYKAARLFFEVASKEGIETGGVDIHIEKNIPVSAGLAGGSTDAAAVLKGLNELYNYALSRRELLAIGASIGSDIPYCIVGGCSYAYGRGEKLKHLESINKAYVLLVKPEFGISTGAAYNAIDNGTDNVHPDVLAIKSILEEGSSDITAIAPYMANTFENVICNEHPVIRDIINSIDENGPVKTMMSGSGPSIFAIFEKKDEAENVADKLKSEYSNIEIYVTELL